MSQRIAILGGGIAGLASAYELRKAFPDSTIRVYEAAERFGGKIVSRRIDGCLLEGGPDSLLTEKPWALQLCRELGLDDQLLGSNDHQRSFSILRKGKLHPFPAGCKLFIPQRITPMITTPLLSLGAKVRMAQEPFRSYTTPEPDESLAAFVSRHFGDEVVERLAGPLLGGIYGGDPEEMSMAATFPRLREMEKNHGSLVRGMRIAMKKMEAARAERGGTTPSLFTSLQGGMQSLVDVLVEQLDAELRPGTSVDSLEKTGEGWLVNGEAFDRVICSLPASIAAPLFTGTLSSLLAKQQTSSSATLSLIFNRKDLLGEPPSGFGFMSAHPIPGLLVGCTWIGNKFEHRIPADRFACRLFLGGANGEQAIREAASVDLIHQAVQELRQICPFIPESPEHSWLQRWPNSNPQYAVGHLDWVQELKTEAERLGGLVFVGSSYEGVSVSDCVRQAQKLGVS